MMAAPANVAAFLQGLQQLSRSDGRNVRIEIPFKLHAVLKTSHKAAFIPR